MGIGRNHGGFCNDSRRRILPRTGPRGLALILIALAALTIDFFSKERGIIYQQELNSIQIEEVG